MRHLGRRALIDGLAVALLSLLLTGACLTPADRAAPDGDAGETTAPRALRVEVLERRPHDPGAFTQGLELADGVLYEGTGLVGRSSLRATDPLTGDVRRAVALSPPFFGEGVTRVGDRLWQLTWQDGVAIEWDAATFTERRRVRYEGEGWGLCWDGSHLVMSDGTARLTFRDPRTFAPTGGVTVRRGGTEQRRLNELECTGGPGGTVWANVWQTDEVVGIDPRSGRVTAVVDAAGLLPAEQRPGADVLNGIAAVPGTDEFLVTGKLWPTLFRVRFVPA
jgi:glutaminyl-peptide cyclotransferase